MQILKFPALHQNLESTRAGLEGLRAAWREKESLILVQEPASVDSAWFDRTLGQVDAAFPEGCFALLTSGSTGAPKLVVGLKSRAEALAHVIHEHQSLEVVQTTVSSLPFTYSYCLVNQWIWSNVFGRPLIPTAGLADPEGWAETLDRSPASMVCLVGSQVSLMRRYFSPGRRFPEVIRVNFAGGVFPAGDLDYLRDLFPRADIYNNFGCTEALPRLTIRKIETVEDAAILGRPLPGVEMHVAEGGALHFRSPYGALAVADAQGLRSFGVGEWIPTGDVGESAGENLWRIVGRGNEVFKRFGEKISLQVIGDALRQVWKRSFAFYLEEEKDGQWGHVLVVAPRPSEMELRGIFGVFREKFRRPHWPVRIESVDDIPFLANGKPDAKSLASLEGKTVVWKQYR